jgi:hypothetical protein
MNLRMVLCGFHQSALKLDSWRNIPLHQLRLRARQPSATRRLRIDLKDADQAANTTRRGPHRRTTWACRIVRLVLSPQTGKAELLT